MGRARAFPRWLYSEFAGTERARFNLAARTRFAPKRMHIAMTAVMRAIVESAAALSLRSSRKEITIERDRIYLLPIFDRGNKRNKKVPLFFYIHESNDR